MPNHPTQKDLTSNIKIQFKIYAKFAPGLHFGQFHINLKKKNKLRTI